MGAIAATDKKKYQYVDYGDGDGTVIGQSPTKKVGMYGFTPVVQANHIADLDVSSSDSADNNSCFVKVNTLLAALRSLGILATA